MKTIKIKSMQLTNFKGIKSLRLDELSQETSIFGNNGTGKTTVFDAFTWLLFGKDSTDRKDFEIKTLDSNNNVIPKIDHVVSAVLDVDGNIIELQKTFREKWVKKRGALEAEFSGNETLYEWNGVPMNAGDYTSKINQLVNEDVFKMITSTTAFNAMKWQDQRNVLIDLAGHVTDADVAIGNKDFESLVNRLDFEGKTLEEYKKQIKASISKSKKELQTIPTRIDEVERGKPEVIDFSAQKALLKSYEERISDVNEQMNDKAKAHEAEVNKKREIQKEIYSVEDEVNDLRHNLKQEARQKFNQNTEAPRKIEAEIAKLDGSIKEIEQTIEFREKKIDFNKRQIHLLDGQRQEAAKKWESKNAEVFKMDEDQCKCPTCKREFEADVLDEQREELERMFNDNKRIELERISDKGQQLKSEIDKYQNDISALTIEKGELKESLKKHWAERADLSEELKRYDNEVISEGNIYSNLLNANKERFDGLGEKILSLKQQLNDIKPIDNSELQAEYRTLSRQRDAVKSDLQKEAQIQEADNRIAQLANDEKQLSQDIFNMEKEQYTIEQFEKAKSDRIESSVNAMFKHIDFKLFKTLINGGEEPTCKALINGVPYSDANTASKINAGLDIINTLSEHYGVTAPIFIDNRESVVELIESPSQIINLVVSEADKKLRVLTTALEELA